LPRHFQQPESKRPRLPVLTAEDNPVIQTAVKFMLKSWGYDPVVARDGLEAWQILQTESAPRLAIFDWMMPGLDGVELCRRVRESSKEPYTYILLLTGRSDSADLVAALDAGADDYLTKPFNSQELRARLQSGRRIVELQQALVAAREALRDQATKDSLTGLLNHASILAALDGDIARTTRAGEPLTVLLADIDRFRQINDTFGHPAGDQVLREAGRRLRAEAPAGATLGRYAGGQFLILLPGCDREAADRHAERLRAALGDTPFAAGAASFPVTCTIGVTGCDPPGSCDPLTILREADESLFWAKREGRQAAAAAAPSFEAAPARMGQSRRAAMEAGRT
jgi:diguanylate cyclase (GGDEF)-like protein